MKSFATIVVGSVLGIVLTYLFVPRRDLEYVPPSRIEFAGDPLAVDDQPTATWDEVNQALRAINLQRRADHDLYTRVQEGASSEIEGPRIRITYVPRNPRNGVRGTKAVVVVKAQYPIGMALARAHPVDLVRWETMHEFMPE